MLSLIGRNKGQSEFNIARKTLDSEVQSQIIFLHGITFGVAIFISGTGENASNRK